MAASEFAWLARVVMFQPLAGPAENCRLTLLKRSRFMIEAHSPAEAVVAGGEVMETKRKRLQVLIALYCMILPNK